MRQAQLLQYRCVMWYLLYKQYWFRWFSHMLSVIQSSSALWSRSPIKAEEWGTSLLCHAHRTPLSVRRSCSPNMCPHPAVSHCGCREKVSDNLTGKMRHLHQIINTLTDRRQSVLGELFATPNISYRDETRMPLLQCLYPEIRFALIFPVDSIETNQLQNESQACTNIYWKWIWKLKTKSINKYKGCAYIFL